MTNLILTLDIGKTNISKRILWDLYADGEFLANGISPYAQGYSGSEREIRDISFADGLVDACRSIKSRLEDKNLVAANLVIKVPSSRLASMINEFTSWGRTSSFKDDLAEKILTALDPLPMQIHALVTRGNDVKDATPTRVDSLMEEASFDFKEEDNG